MTLLHIHLYCTTDHKCTMILHAAHNIACVLTNTTSYIQYGRYTVVSAVYIGM